MHATLYGKPQWDILWPTVVAHKPICRIRACFEALPSVPYLRAMDSSLLSGLVRCDVSILLMCKEHANPTTWQELPEIAPLLNFVRRWRRILNSTSSPNEA